MSASPAPAIRPLPPNPPPISDNYESSHSGTFGPPVLPPINSFNDSSFALQNDGDGPPQSPLLDTPNHAHTFVSPPNSPGFPQKDKGKKPTNPLTDLIDSEEQFVALMSAIIRVRLSPIATGLTANQPTESCFGLVPR